MGRKSKIIRLIAVDHIENDRGNLVEVDVSTKQVFTEKKSIKRNEFYQAAATGFKPEITFEVWTFEYNEEQVVEYEGKRYSVIRNYETDAKNTELICSGLVNKVV